MKSQSQGYDLYVSFGGYYSICCRCILPIGKTLRRQFPLSALFGDCLFEELPCPRHSSMDGPHPKLIRVGIKLRPSWPNLEWLWKTTPVLEPYCGRWRPSFRLRQSSFLCLVILVLFPAFFSVSWFCLTGNPAWNTFLKTLNYRDFPGGPMAKTPCSQCRGPGLNLWSGN